MRIVASCPVVLSSLVVLLPIACGGRAQSAEEGSSPQEQDPASPPAAPPGRTADGCVEGLGSASMVRGLNPARDIDAITFVGLDEQHYIEVVIEQFGEPCEPASVGSSCILALEGRKTGFYTANQDTPRALIVTVGDESEALGYQGLREFLGEIDTPNEAAVIAWSEGWEISCTQIRALDEQWILVPRDVGCTGPQGWFSVERDATVSHSAFCEGGGQ